MKPRRIAGAVAMGVGVALIVAASPVASQPMPPDNPLEASRRAAGSQAFSGQVLVRWRDAAGEHEQLVDVRAVDGNLMVEGDAAVLARRDERFIRRSGGWDALWPAGLDAPGVPWPTSKYTLSSAAGPLVAGRPSTLVEVYRGADLIERVWVDAATGLLLGREQYAVAGSRARSMQFQQISLGAPAGRPVPSPHVRPREVSTATSSHLPRVLPGQYRRLAAYKRDGIVHGVYSDGVYGLSVFEQPGRLRESALPARGQPVSVGRTRGWHYAWAGGNVLLWEGRDRVFSAVGDGPLPDLVQAGAAVPLGPKPSLLQRFRSACGHALRALTGRS